MSKEKVYGAIPSRLHKKIEVLSADELGRDFLYHLSSDSNIRKFIPQVSNRTMNIEDRSIPRVSTSAHLAGAMSAAQFVEWDFQDSRDDFDGRFTVYGIEFEYALKPDRSLLPDRNQTDEYWLISYDRQSEEYKPRKLAEFSVLSLRNFFKAEKWELDIVIQINDAPFYLRPKGRSGYYELDRGHYRLTLRTGWVYFKEMAVPKIFEIIEQNKISKSEYEKLRQDYLSLEQLRGLMMSEENYSHESSGVVQRSQMTLRQRDYKNLAVLANAVQIGTDALTKIMGNEIANSVDGQQLSRSEIQRTLAAKIQSYIRSE